MSNSGESANICSHCNAPITQANFVLCHSCERKFHFSPCTVISESSYYSMSANKKTEWKCHICKPRVRSPNNGYQTYVYKETTVDSTRENAQQKQQREGEEINRENAKRFKEALTPTSINKTPTITISNQCEISELKTSMMNLQTSMHKSFELFCNNLMQQMAANTMTLTASNNEIKQQLSEAVTKINETLSQLSSQVVDLQEKDKEKERRIESLEKRVQQLEQKNLNNNIEINNVSNLTIEPIVVVQKIAASVGMELKETDVNSARRIKRNNKILVEFVSTNIKKEFMQKLKGHRIDSNVLSENHNEAPTKIYIYVNDELTAYNRRLLWMAKTRAKECGWKFVWIKNGSIFARKSETMPSIIINNSADIESFNN
ncbi:uncharacterized protein LOC142225921 [Haematobia irritans]|uniref:uncharacterized protein LOC142225921 n=1 Tax=Haematobia irritans TaxID=7368 RepID=UPI003F4FC86D